MNIGLDEVVKILEAVRMGVQTTQPAPVDDNDRYAVGELSADPGVRAASLAATPRYTGHHTTLTEDQAAAFQMMMLIQGHTGDTVGRGRVIPAPGAHVNQDPDQVHAPPYGRFLSHDLGVDPLHAEDPANPAPNTGREQVAGA